MFFFHCVRPFVQTSKLAVTNYLGSFSGIRSVATSAATMTQEVIPSMYRCHQPNLKQLWWKPSSNPDLTGILRMLLLQQKSIVNSNSRSVITNEFVTLGRNRRKGKRANRGKRPCSHVRRRAKRSQYGNPKR
jgi:hypothetical protein